MDDFQFLADLRVTSEDQAPQLWWDLAVKQVEAGIELARFDGVMNDFLRRVMAHALSPADEPVGKTFTFTFDPGLMPVLKKGDRSAAGHSTQREGFREASAADKARLAEVHGYKVPGHWKEALVPDDESAGLIVKGRDQKDKWHYVYSAEYREGQASAKFQRVKELHKAMPKLDEALKRDVAAGDEDAIVVGIMRETGARVGSDANNAGRLVRDHTYGASTLRAKHITVNPSGSVTIKYKGKDGVEQKHLIKDPVLAAALAAKKEGKSGNDSLFPNATDGSTMEYLRTATGLPKAKNHDLRTYVATGMALTMVRGRPPKTAKEYKAKRAAIGKAVAAQLGNTPAIALGTYIDPTVFSGWANPEWGV
jgi:DNA topoisomerase IB